MSVADKHIVITGATGGIGLAAALKLATEGARITLIARNPDKAEAAIEQINTVSSRLDHSVVEMDFASLASVRSAATSWLEQSQQRGDSVDVLLNNAGVVNTSRHVTVDGFEETFAVNHLAPFLLTGILLPALTHEGSRIVNVASHAYTFVKGMDFTDLQSERKYKVLGAYGQSKLANILFTDELSRRLSERGVTCNCLHPGAVRTGLGKQNNAILGRIVSLVVAPFFKTPEQGAATSVYLCNSEKVANVSGKYFANRREAKLKPWARDAEAAQRLWQLSEVMVEFNYPI